MTEAPIRRRPGTPCWVSLMVHSLGTTRGFYGALFGWTFVTVPGAQQFGPYVRAVLDGKEVAGIGELAPGRRMPLAWTTYLATDDADATAEAIRGCGGTVGVGPLDAGEEGRLAMASDPAGAVFGIWQARAHTGTAVAGPHGTPVWNELVTREAAWVSTFYRSVFGYDLEATARPSRRSVTTSSPLASVASRS